MKHPLINAKRAFVVWAALLLVMVSANRAQNRSFHIRTVVIDAGHGGHDSGCLGGSSREKDVTLAISLKLGRMIEEAYPDVRVIYTRKKDVFVELHERAGIANRAKADLFICVHANAGTSAAFGAETFVMGLHKTDANLEVSRRENAAILLEEDYEKKYDGFDPKSPEAHIIFSLFQNAFMHQSLSFASKVQLEFEEYAGRYNRGVKQAGFLVLYRTSMPAVLIETGFLTNKAEERYLLSKKGENDISTSIFRAFRAYKLDMESMSEPRYTTKQTPKPAPKKPEPRAKQPVKKKEETAPVASTPAPVRKSEAGKAPTLFYGIQIGASANGKEPPAGYHMKDLRLIDAGDGFTRFVVGRYSNLGLAIERQTKLRQQGFKDAFVTPYLDGKRISLKLAAEIENKN